MCVNMFIDQRPKNVKIFKPNSTYQENCNNFSAKIEQNLQKCFLEQKLCLHIFPENCSFVFKIVFHPKILAEPVISETFYNPDSLELSVHVPMCVSIINMTGDLPVVKEQTTMWVLVS